MVEAANPLIRPAGHRAPQIPSRHVTDAQMRPDAARDEPTQRRRPIERQQAKEAKQQPRPGTLDQISQALLLSHCQASSLQEQHEEQQGVPAHIGVALRNWRADFVRFTKIMGEAHAFHHRLAFVGQHRHIGVIGAFRSGLSVHSCASSHRPAPLPAEQKSIPTRVVRVAGSLE